jgi:hypothetical protein
LLLYRAVAPASRCLQTATRENAEAATAAVDQTCFPELAYGNRYACPAHAEHCYRAVKEQYERSGPARHCAFPYKKLTVLIGERSLYAKDGTPGPQRKPHLSPIWGGIGMQADEIMMVGPGQRVHARTDELCRGGAIRLPASDFVADEPVEFQRSVAH